MEMDVIKDFFGKIGEMEVRVRRGWTRGDTGTCVLIKQWKPSPPPWPANRCNTRKTRAFVKSRDYLAQQSINVWKHFSRQQHQKTGTHSVPHAGRILSRYQAFLWWTVVYLLLYMQQIHMSIKNTWQSFMVVYTTISRLIILLFILQTKVYTRPPFPF